MRRSGIIYIPTNRLCRAAIAHAARECSDVAKHTGDHFALLVVDQPSGAHTEPNRAALRQWATDEGVPWAYVTEQVWGAMCEAILARLRLPEKEGHRLQAVLNRRGIAYGVAVNRAYLTAAALGVETLYRRDSDHLPAKRADGFAYPAVLEAQAIGRPLGEIETRERAGGNSPSSRSIVRWIGSNMYGEAPIDRRDLLSVDQELGVELDAITHPGAPRSRLLERQESYYFREPGRWYEDDFYELDLTGKTEVGVSCVQGLFRELPEMPIPETLGCDYMGKNLLYQLGLPVLYHSRKMIHTYDAERTLRSPGQAAAYGLRELRYLILRRLWNNHNARLRSRSTEIASPSGIVRADAYAESFEETLGAADGLTANVVRNYIDIYSRGAARSTGKVHGRLAAVVHEAKSQEERLVPEVVDGVREYCWLVRLWPSVVSAATRAHDSVRRIMAAAGGGHLTDAV